MLVTLNFWEVAFIRCNRIQVEPGVTQTFAWVPIYFYLKPALELDFKCSNRSARNIPVSWLFSTCLHSNEASNGRRWSILRLPHKKDRDPLKILFFLRKIRILSATEDSLTMALILFRDFSPLRPVSNEASNGHWRRSILVSWSRNDHGPAALSLNWEEFAVLDLKSFSKRDI